jgi:ribosomal protein S11
MAVARFHVLHHEGAWAVRKDREVYGPFATQQAAVAHAAKAACHASEYGVRTHIVVHAGRGRYRLARPGFGARTRRLATALNTASSELWQAARLLLQPR